MPSNVSVATFRAWKNAPTDPTDTLIQYAIDAAEEAVNDHCGRVFTVASTASQRLYTPYDQRSTVLRIHDCTSVTAIVDDGSTLTSDQFQLEPVNGLLANGSSSPYTQIRMMSGAYWTYDEHRACVAVTATWGWSALPDRYTNAVLILTADILDQRALQNGVIGFTEYAGIRVKANPMVSSLLRRLRRSESWGIG
jgi:hypothetical protein